MKKALITMIIILSALILGIVMFVIGVQITSEKNGKSDSDKSSAAESLVDKETSDNTLGNNGGQPALPIDPDYDPIPEPTPEPTLEPQPEPEPTPQLQPNGQLAYPDYPQGNNEWYRVRTSAGSGGKRDGAFKSFANAKAHAITLKEQGYKVYDDDMNCIYIP